MTIHQLLRHIPPSNVISGNSEGKLRVLNINMWGLKWPLAMHQRERFKALSEILGRSNYDVVLLQEVWYRYQYDIIKGTFPYVSPFRTMNGCSGIFPFPIECSGLVILSRHPVKKFWYKSYSVRGWLIIDGQFAVRKGLGIARIWWNGMTVDVSTSHLSTYTMSAMENLHERMVQTMETVDILRKSSADIKGSFIEMFMLDAFDLLVFPANCNSTGDEETTWIFSSNFFELFCPQNSLRGPTRHHHWLPPGK